MAHSFTHARGICRVSLLGVAMLAGCAAVIGTETRFSPWNGESVVRGQGGAVESVDGIEFWSHGAPSKPYRVIGVIEQSTDDDPVNNLLFGKFNRSEVIGHVRKAGGHGVVTVATDRVGTAQTVQRNAVMAVFRYEPQ